MDLGSREVMVSDGVPSGRAAMHSSVREEMFSNSVSVNVWSLAVASEEAAARDTTCACWELDQAAAELCNATVVVPSGGQLHVLNGSGVGTWKDVTVTGVLPVTASSASPLSPAVLAYRGPCWRERPHAHA